jgi:hypothetical protein
VLNSGGCDVEPALLPSQLAPGVWGVLEPPDDTGPDASDSLAQHTSDSVMVCLGGFFSRTANACPLILIVFVVLAGEDLSDLRACVLSNRLGGVFRGDNPLRLIPN